MIVVLAGGVGGAKMAQGMQRALPAGELTVVVNVADDFELHSLRISPDIDTVLYTLGGIANPVTGWGIAGDTRVTQEAMTRLGADPWFILGDQDLATHMLRTTRLNHGESLSEITADFARSLGIQARILPATDDPIATLVSTPDGILSFQDYFVRRRQQDDVLAINVDGIDEAEPADGVLDAIARADVVVIAPSNPIVSIGPILDIPGVRDALKTTRAIRVAVSPIVGGQALKGPADKMLRTLDHESSALGVARIYADIIDGFVLDTVDAELANAIEELGLSCRPLQSIMGDEDDRARFASEVLSFARDIQRVTS